MQSCNAGGYQNSGCFINWNETHSGRTFCSACSSSSLTRKVSWSSCILRDRKLAYVPSIGVLTYLIVADCAFASDSAATASVSYSSPCCFLAPAMREDSSSAVSLLKHIFDGDDVVERTSARHCSVRPGQRNAVFRLGRFQLRDTAHRLA